MLRSVLAVMLVSGCAAGPGTDEGGPSGGGKADGPDGASVLFGPDGPAELTIEGAFAPAFKAARAGQPDGVFPLPRVTDPFAGQLTYRDGDHDVRIAVELEVRGNSSLTECAFPKLKLGIDRANAKSTVFADARKLKIGTHCGDGGAGTIGRLRDQKATWREAATYTMMRALGLPSQAAKPLVITYVDTTTSKRTTRQAFLLEHIDLLAPRLGGTGMKDPELYDGDPAKVMDAQAIVRVHLFEALVGNWDWHLRLGPPMPTVGPQLWNIEAVETGARLIPVASDFDLSSAVTTQLARPDTLDPAVLPDEPSQLVRQAANYLASEYGPTFAATELAAARTHFVSRRAALEQAIDDAQIDDDGRANLRAHVEAFYTALDHLDEIMAAGSNN